MEVQQFELNDEQIRLEANNITDLVNRFCDEVKARLHPSQPGQLRSPPPGRHIEIQPQEYDRMSCSHWLPKLLMAALYDRDEFSERAQ